METRRREQAQGPPILAPPPAPEVVAHQQQRCGARTEYGESDRRRRKSSKTATKIDAFPCYSVIFISVVLVLVFSLSSADYVQQGHQDFSGLARDLRQLIHGRVFPRGSPYYERFRAVHNGACSHIYPGLIARPVSTEDVSQIVRFARERNVEISIRSGGHSYQCQGTKQGRRGARGTKILYIRHYG